MTTMRTGLMMAAIAGLAVAGGSLPAAEPQRSPADWLKYFSKRYNNTAWTNKSLFRPAGYMWPADNDHWQTRMLAMQGLVQKGTASIEPLIAMLKSGRPGERTFAAQTLGYLAPGVPTAPLLAAARSDSSAAVRLYAVDALGMHGGTDIDWKSLRKSEKNRDVLKHIGYAVERKGQPVAASVVRTLKSWNPKTINTAVVGNPAPDFQLVSANGRTIRLSSYRGKFAVVLVFIYGDT